MRPRPSIVRRHGAAIGIARRLLRREWIGPGIRRNTGTLAARRGRIGNRIGRRQRLDLIGRVFRPARLLEIAEEEEVRRMAVRADLPEHLEAAPQLVLVIAPENAGEAPGLRLDFGDRRTDGGRRLCSSAPVVGRRRRIGRPARRCGGTRRRTRSILRTRCAGGGRRRGRRRRLRQSRRHAGGEHHSRQDSGQNVRSLDHFGFVSRGDHVRAGLSTLSEMLAGSGRGTSMRGRNGSTIRK